MYICFWYQQKAVMDIMEDNQPREMNTTHDELLEFPISTESLPRCLDRNMKLGYPDPLKAKEETGRGSQGSITSATILVYLS